MSIAQERRIAELEQELAELKQRQTISWVGNRLGEALAIQKAATPYDQWSSSDKQTLHAVCGDALTAYYLYVENLPKS